MRARACVAGVLTVVFLLRNPHGSDIIFNVMKAVTLWEENRWASIYSDGKSMVQFVKLMWSSFVGLRFETSSAETRNVFTKTNAWRVFVLRKPGRLAERNVLGTNRPERNW